MNKKTLATVLALVITPVTVLAASENANQGESTQNSAQVQVQTQTQNADESTQIQTQTETKTEAQIEAQIEKDVTSTKQQYKSSDDTTKGRAGEVAKAVENILEVANQASDSTIGDQIRTIAKEQNKSEDGANKAMDKLQSRNKVSRFFIGPDFKQVKAVEQIMEQNRQRVRELQQIMTQLENTDDASAIQNQINILEIQNLNLANQLDKNERGFSLFGWLIRWFYRI
ncbi:hypothetical protein COT78_01770 [Candidatus Berkelbacteria bacterium CG10_big_fil_rev_8_21_14_0_10_43_13]|uniref:DUF5667 domain-containing protein n=1 Tax=Candidatus Berkelbacteria bacterium CG10_big_fil_rev_8_21_14_0_10_43_13 TaxID=1974514 RepID=A0A2H0W8S8_9BACT|nr:MAG: hypothetical protein COT78_01770 [Candidatus Berkelbacteria bacterium CG10_big_fil_rev_8_21_14_0_10_43_13]